MRKRLLTSILHCHCSNIRSERKGDLHVRNILIINHLRPKLNSAFPVDLLGLPVT